MFPGEGAPRSIDFRAELNDDQYAAVTAEPGPALVLAGAGSGKTRTLTYRVAYLNEQGVPHWQILLLTFTNKAAREMLGRVEGLVGERFPAEWGGTFHSIGARILRRHGPVVGLEPGFTILDADDAEKLFAQTLKDFDKGFVKVKDNPTPKVLHNLISYARNTRRPVQGVVEERFPWLPKIVEPVAQFARLYRQRKLELQVTDYDDLLELWLELLQKDDIIRERYQRQFRHILVDEYQDTNLLQSEIVDLLAGDHQLMAVGDDAQCIYTWRGAEFENIRNFTERHPGTRIYKIEQNYRSTAPILDFANQVLRNQDRPAGFDKELRAHREGHLKPVVVPCSDPVGQARFIVDKVQDLYHDDGRSLGDICVLYRAHFQAMELQMELSRNQIPFTITSGMRFFEQAHVRDFVAMLRFLSNPTDAPAFERFAGLLPKVGPKTAQRIHKAALTLVEKQKEANVKAAAEKGQKQAKPQELNLFDWADGKAEEVAATPTKRSLPEHPAALLTEGSVVARVPETALEHWDQLALTMRDAWAEMNRQTDAEAEPAEIVRILIEGWYGDYLLTAYENGDSRREDLNALIEFAGQYENLQEMLAQLVLLSTEGAEKGQDVDGTALRLSTIHQAKGLEYPVVFVIGLCDGMFPLQRAMEEGDIEEERRLFYVAVTRAEDRLYLCYPNLLRSRGTLLQASPSMFIQQVPPQYYERLGPRRRWD